MTNEGFDPIEYINTPRWHYSSLGLDRIKLLLAKLGNPQDKFPVVHVAGTNGKGSTCAYIAGILRATGRKTALFTSPYVECFEERISIDGENISLKDLRKVTLLVRDAAAEVEAEYGEHPTEFELMAAVAFVHFARSEVDVAVVEVGLGGTLDATNVVNPDLCVITRIGLDHTETLGDTLAQIAGEKAGIIKPGVPVVSWPQEAEAMEVIQARCEELSCSLTCADFSQLEVGSINPEIFKREFTYKNMHYETHLIASYQPFNAAVALEAIEHLPLLEDSRERLRAPILVGIALTKWPGRFEVMSQDPLIVIDGTHNPQGAEALSDTLRDLEEALIVRAEQTNPTLDDGEVPMDDALPVFAENSPFVAPIVAGPTFASKEYTMVMGVLADKEYPHIIAPLAPYARRFVVYTPSNPRALSADDLARAIHEQVPDREVIVCETPAEAMTTACDLVEPNSMILAFGTLYAIGALKQTLRDLGKNDIEMSL